MKFQFPTFEFVATVALFAWLLDLLELRYCAILMFLSGPFYFPRIRRYFRNSIKNACVALSELFSIRGAAAAAVAVLPYLAMIYLGIISQPQRRDAAALIVLFTFNFVTAPFLVYDASASVPESRTTNRDTEKDPAKLTRWKNEDLREALEAAGKSTQGNKSDLVSRLAAVRREAMAEDLAVGSRVTMDGAYGSVAALRDNYGLWDVRLDGEDTVRRVRLEQFEPVTSAPVASLVPFLKDCASAAGASALLYLLLDYLWLFILYLTSSADWRREATISVVLSTLVGAGVYCLYRYHYCRVLSYKVPPTNVTMYKRTIGDRVHDFLNPPTTVEDFLPRHGLSEYETNLGHFTLEQLSLKTHRDLLDLGVESRKATRLLTALRELPPGPTHFRDLEAQFKATDELPEKLRTCELILSSANVTDIMTKHERLAYEKITGIDARYYKAPSWLDPPSLHQIHNAAVARQEAYFSAFHAENSARMELLLPFTRSRLASFAARRETQSSRRLCTLLSRKEMAELAELEEALPGLERQATARALAERGFVQKLPTEKRPEDWTDEEKEGHERTMEFLKKPQSEQIEILRNILPKLTSCACEIGWAAAILALWALYLMFEESGNTAAADDAFDKLLKALVRVNFWYSREHFLLCGVPEEAVKVAVKATTTDAVRFARKGKGIKVDVEKRQQVLGFPLSAKAYASVWPVKKNKWRWARDNFDKHFYGVGAGVVGLSGILYALYAISVCVSMAGVGLSSIHFIHFIFTCVSTVVDAGWPAVCAAACVFVTWIVGTVIQVAARWRGMGVRYAAGIGYGVSNGSACMILLVCYGTGLNWPLWVGTQLLLAAPPVRLMLGFDDRFLRLISGPSSKSQLLLPAPRASLGIAICKELVIWTGLSLVASAGFSSTPYAVFTLLIVVVCAFLVADWNPTLMACALLGAALFFGMQFTGFDWAGAMGPIFSYARCAVGWLLVLRWWCLLFVEGFRRFVIVDVHFPVTRLFYLCP